MKQNGAVYFYNLNSERGRKIRMLCLTLGLKIRVVDRAQYTEAIGAIAGVRDIPSAERLIKAKVLKMRC